MAYISTTTTTTNGDDRVAHGACVPATAATIDTSDRHARAVAAMTGAAPRFHSADVERAVATMVRDAELATAALLPPDAPPTSAALPLAAGVPLPPSDGSTRFHSVEYPAVAFGRFVVLLAKRAGFDADVVMYALGLMRKAATRLPAGRLTAHVLHRLYLACAFAASKMVWDRYLKVSSYCKASGLPQKDVLEGERRVFELCGWSLHLDPGALADLTSSITIDEGSSHCHDVALTPQQQQQQHPTPADNATTTPSASSSTKPAPVARRPASAAFITPVSRRTSASSASSSEASPTKGESNAPASPTPTARVIDVADTRSSSLDSTQLRASSSSSGNSRRLHDALEYASSSSSGSFEAAA